MCVSVSLPIFGRERDIGGHHLWRLAAGIHYGRIFLFFFFWFGGVRAWICNILLFKIQFCDIMSADGMDILGMQTVGGVGCGNHLDIRARLICAYVGCKTYLSFRRCCRAQIENEQNKKLNHISIEYFSFVCCETRNAEWIFFPLRVIMIGAVERWCREYAYAYTTFAVSPQAF